MSEDVITTIIVAVIMVIGLIGTLVPVLPGILAMWVIALAYGFALGWTPFGVGVMVVISLLTAASIVVGYLLPQKAAAGAGANRWSQLWAAVAAVIGFFVIPVVGVIVGALVGMLAAEWWQRDSLSSAWSSTLATAKGFGASALAQFAIGWVMLVAWSFWAASLVVF